MSRTIDRRQDLMIQHFLKRLQDNSIENDYLTKSMAYGTLRFNAAITRALQPSPSRI